MKRKIRSYILDSKANLNSAPSVMIEIYHRVFIQQFYFCFN